MYRYLQIMDYIKEKYIDGNESGKTKKLPSIRDVMLYQKCSKNSVIKAYEELEKQHLIYVIPQSGYYVMEGVRKETQEEEDINLITANPDSKVLPYREFVHCINRTTEEFGELLFQYPSVQGFPQLRHLLVDVFADRQVYCKEEDIFITNGIEQAISLLYMKNNWEDDGDNDIKKDTILFEIPTYPLAYQLALRWGWKVAFVKREEKGIDMVALERLFSNGTIKFFYTMPRFQNPLGTCLTEKQKKKIAELAEQYGVYIIEDDYLAELEPKKSRAPIHYYDVANRVIYLAGFSKSFMPGIRIGAAIIPPDLQQTFATNKHLTDLGTSMLEQGALALFIKNGMYKKHQKKLRQIYSNKMKFVRKYLENNTDISCSYISESGYYCWLPLENKLSDKEVDTVVKKLKEQHILVKSGSTYCPEGEGKKGIRICIANCEKDRIIKALQIINTEIQNILKKY